MAVLAIDAGGTRIKLAVVAGGTLLARGSLDARSDDGLAAALPRIAAELRAMLPTGMEAAGLGLAFPSLIDGDRIVGDVGKYQDAETIDLAAWAREEFKVPFAVENDARMATIGEWRYGVAQGYEDVVMITLGTGIGTGVISGGSVLRGRHGAAGILGGHMTARVGGRPCPCGNVGCWETEASTAALPHLDPGGRREYAEIFAAAELGEPHAVQLRDQSVAVWSALTVSLIHAYDPEVLVIGGGITASGEALLDPIRRHVERHAWTPWGRTRIERSTLGDDAALLACEWLVQNRIGGQGEAALA